MRPYENICKILTALETDLLKLFFDRGFVEFPLDVEHEVAGDYSCVSFSAGLGIDGVVDVAQVVEDVEAVKHPKQVALQHRICHSGIPNIVVLIQ